MKITRYLLITLYLLVVIKLWFAPIGSSYWLDETLTYWNVMKGPYEAMLRSAECPGQFQLYMIITALFAKLFGLSEVVLRLPSLIAGLFSSYLMYLLGRRFANSEVGLVAMILFACIPEIYPYVSNARPYALMLLCALSALWLLIRFHDNGRWIHGVGYVAAVVSMVYMHYISLPFISILILYSVQQILRNNNKLVNEYKILALHTISLVMMLPLFYMVIYSGKDTSALSFVDTPNVYQLLDSVFDEIFLLVCLLFLFNKFILYKKTDNIFPIYSIKTDIFVCTWFVAPILLAFIVSIITNYKIFVLRYFIVSYPASVFLLAGILGKIKIEAVRVVSVLLVCLYSLTILPSHPLFENWRGALSAARQLTEKGDKTLLLFNSGLIETRWPGWEYQQSDNYKLAPLAAYPIKTEIVPLPMELSDEARLYLERFVVKKVSTFNKFVVVYRGYNSPVEFWIRKRLSAEKLKRSNIGPFEGVSVILYERFS